MRTCFFSGLLQGVDSNQVQLILNSFQPSFKLRTYVAFGDLRQLDIKSWKEMSENL